jgi:hypothetical protein
VTADPHHTKPGPGEPLYGPGSASTPVGGTPGGPNPLNGPQTGAQGFESEQEAADNPLREQIAAAIDGHGLIHLDARMFSGHNCCADAVLAVRDREMEQLRARIATLEHVAAGNKRHVQLIIPDLRRAKTTLARVRDVCDQLRRASVLADGEPHTDRERGVIQAITRVLAALDQPAAHDSGPAVAEATADDRQWPLQKGGE